MHVTNIFLVKKKINDTKKDCTFSVICHTEKLEMLSQTAVCYIRVFPLIEMIIVTFYLTR